jgi:hypothetical protein
MKFLRNNTKYTLFDHKRNQDTVKERPPVLETINKYKYKWIQCVCRMDRSWLLHTITKYQPAGKEEPRPPIEETSGLLYNKMQYFLFHSFLTILIQIPVGIVTVTDIFIYCYMHLNINVQLSNCTTGSENLLSIIISHTYKLPYMRDLIF